MKVSLSLKYILDNINRCKKVTLIRFTPTLYSLVNILEKEFGIIKNSFVFKQ